MPEYAELRAEYQKRRSGGETYESIAGSTPAIITRAHVWKIINKAWQPDDPKLRDALGLPPKSTVVVINAAGGSVPPGAQVHHALKCACSRWFVPNHPLRKRCFICGPYRGRRVKRQRDHASSKK